jgi:hypothetical protein
LKAGDDPLAENIERLSVRPHEHALVRLPMRQALELKLALLGSAALCDGKKIEDIELH